MDSIRRLVDYDLVQPGMGLALDEFAPKRAAVGSQGGGVDFLKNVLDPDMKTLEGRYNDFALCEGIGRVVTTQSIEKLLLGMRFEDAQHDADMQAIMKRCLFVECSGAVLPKAIQRQYQSEKQQAFSSAMVETINAGRGNRREVQANNLDMVFFGQ